jgi:hypothetical protein
MCAFEEHWQVLLARVGLWERFLNKGSVLVYEVIERCLPLRRLPGKDKSRENRVCSAALDFLYLRYSRSS